MKMSKSYEFQRDKACLMDPDGTAVQLDVGSGCVSYHGESLGQRLGGMTCDMLARYSRS
jgi:hypothetical protein